MHVPPYLYYSSTLSLSPPLYVLTSSDSSDSTPPRASPVRDEEHSISVLTRTRLGRWVTDPVAIPASVLQNLGLRSAGEMVVVVVDA